MSPRHVFIAALLGALAGSLVGMFVYMDVRATIMEINANPYQFVR
jgi:hypothetical protein